MADDEVRGEGFLGRWSRRKAAVRQGSVAASEPPATVPAPAPAPTPAPVAQAAETVPEPGRPAPTLEDAQALTSESDFRPFAARDVAPQVRNTAMRKLFADPHFNVMDRMDVYIDDYSKPDPISPAALRQLASAQFLGLFDDEEKAARKDPAPAPGGVNADAPASDAVAQSPLCNELPSQPAASAQPASQPDDAHADLRLQPDDAAPGEDPGRGAG